jgi:hypothetical protein
MHGRLTHIRMMRNPVIAEHMPGAAMFKAL